MEKQPIEASTATTVTSRGETRLSFAGCGYLGLGHHPEVLEAASAALATSGMSTAASRTTSGTHVEHERLEDDLANFLEVESAVLTTDGLIANIAAADAIRRAAEGPHTALLEAGAHASLVDAARAAGMHVVELADEPRRIEGDSHVAILLEGVRPMAGRVPPLHEHVAALRDGDSILLDDSHGFGVLGPTGRGSLERADVRDERIVMTASLAKAIGCAGGFVAGNAASMERVRESPSWIGTTPIPPAAASAARTALSILVREPERIEKLRALTTRLHSMCEALDFEVPALEHPVRALRFESDEEGRRVEQGLWQAGLHVPYVRYLDDGAALKVAVNAEHSIEDVARLQDALSVLR